MEQGTTTLEPEHVLEDEDVPNITHGRSFDPNKCLCGYEGDPGRAPFSEPPPTCVVCCDIWDNMPIHLAYALVLFWGGSLDGLD